MIKMITFKHNDYEVAAVVEIAKSIRGAFVAPEFFRRAKALAESRVEGGGRVLVYALDDVRIDGAAAFAYSEDRGLRVSRTKYLNHDLVDCIRSYRPPGVSISGWLTLEEVGDKVADEIISITKAILNQTQNGGSYA